MSDIRVNMVNQIQDNHLHYTLENIFTKTDMQILARLEPYRVSNVT